MPPLLPLLGFSSSWQGEFSDKKSFERSHECERDKWNGASSWHYCYQLMQLSWVDAQPHTRFKNNECPRILCPFLSTRIEYLMFWNNSSEKVTKLCHMPGFLSDTLRIKLSQVSVNYNDKQYIHVSFFVRNNRMLVICEAPQSTASRQLTYILLYSLITCT